MCLVFYKVWEAVAFEYNKLERSGEVAVRMDRSDNQTTGWQLGQGVLDWDSASLSWLKPWRRL